MIRDGKVYSLSDPISSLYVYIGNVGNVVTIDVKRYLKGLSDLILGVDYQNNIIVFYIYRYSSKEFFKLYCDLSSGKVWKSLPSSEELERLKNLASKISSDELKKLVKLEVLKSLADVLKKLKIKELKRYVGMNILYDINNDKVIMIVWSVHVSDININEVIKECNPRLYEFVKFLNSIGSLYDSYPSWDYFRLCAKAFEFKDLLEESGLIESKPVKLLLRPWLLPSAYVIISMPYLMTSLACLMLLKYLWKLIISNTVREPLDTICGVILELLPLIGHYVADRVSKLLAEILLGNDKIAYKVWNDVSVEIGIPVIWEPLKRLIIKITRPSILPPYIHILKLLIEECYKVMELIYKLTIKEEAMSKSKDLPLLIETLLHSIHDSGISLDDWTSLLRPILSAVGGVVISAVIGLK